MVAFDIKPSQVGLDALVGLTETSTRATCGELDSCTNASRQRLRNRYFGWPRTLATAIAKSTTPTHTGIQKRRRMSKMTYQQKCERLLVRLSACCLIGSLAFAFAWVGLGIASSKTDFDAVVVEDGRWLPFVWDGLGHYLCAMVVVMSFLLAHYTRAILDEIKPSWQFWRDLMSSLKWQMIWAGPATFIVCALFAFSNAIHVGGSDAPRIWWSRELSLDWFGNGYAVPAFVAAMYYCIAVFPLLFTQIVYAALLRKVCEDLQSVFPLDCFDPRRRFGAQVFGDAILLGFVISAVCVIPPIPLQSFSGQGWTVTGWLTIPIAMVVVVNVSYTPLRFLTRSLRRFQREVLERLKSAAGGMEHYEIAAKQRAFPVSPVGVILSICSSLPALAAAALQAVAKFWS